MRHTVFTEQHNEALEPRVEYQEVSDKMSVSLKYKTTGRIPRRVTPSSPMSCCVFCFNFSSPICPWS